MRLYILQPICLALLFVVFWPVFFADFAYMDEAHQLWYNDTDANFTMCLVQGRLLTGFIMQKLFSAISTINELKWIRILSFAGWVVAVLVWNIVLDNWKKVFNLNERWVFLLSIFLPCSIPIAIAIGWASCVELFLAFIFALLGGQLLFNNIYEKKSIHISTAGTILILLLSVCSLFLYQPMFGAFLLPFFMYHLNNRFKKADKVLFIGLAFYLAISLLYFFLFKYSLLKYSTGASDRTMLSVNPLGKVSFFFSQPLAQAFSFNFLYNMHGIFSQAFYPVMFVVWIISVFASEKGERLVWKLTYIIRVLLIMMLIYISVLVAREKFASYRTMLCLNLAGAMLLIDAILRLTDRNVIKNMFTYIACGTIITVGWYNFNLNYIKPLKKEYQVLQTYFQQNYDSLKTKIYFVRPSEYLFTRLYNVNVYKDEFGLPSTFKDWTPEPLIRQMVFESTGNKDKARQISIVNLPHEGRDSINYEVASLVIDAERILSQ